jgi:hypothetical protein
VDSEWLARKVAELGPKEALSRVNGAMACIWWDDGEKAMYAYRNDERPLHIATETDRTLHINSTVDSLAWLKGSFGLNYEAKDIRTFVSGTLYKFPLKDPQDWEETKITRWSPPVTVYKNDTRSLVDHFWKERAPKQSEVIDADVVGGQTVEDPVFDRQVLALFSGELHRVIYLGNGAKYVYKSSGVVDTEYGFTPPESLKGLTRLERKDDLTISVSRILENGTASIKDYGQADFFKMFAAAEKDHNTLPGDCRPQKGKVVKFHTKVQRDGKTETAKHKGLCTRDNPRYLQVYHNQFDGTYKVGSIIMFEPFEYYLQIP